MNLRLSITMLVARSNMSQRAFEVKHKFGQGFMSKIKRRNSCDSTIIDRLAKADGVPVSTFIKWGEE